jgi:putative membrane protein
MNSRLLRFLLLLAVTGTTAILIAQEPLAPHGQDPLAPQSTQIPNPSTQDSNTGGSTVQNMRDKTFLRKATEGGLAEVEFGKLAAQKGASDDVKDFGQKMVDDHTKLNQTIAPLADSMGVMVPTHLNKEDQAEYEKLSALSGDDFDKAYITAMVKDHHEDLRDFRIEANATTDPTLKDAVTDGARVIHDHMVMIDKIARSKGIATPGGHNRPPTPPAA